MTFGGSLWAYLVAGHIKDFFILLLNQYFPFGVFFWLVGAAIFTSIHYSTKNLGYAGGVASLYFIWMGSSDFVVSVYSAMAMRYFGIILGVIIGWYIYRSIKG